MKKSIGKELWEYIKMIIFVLIFVLVVNNFLIINAKIPSPSMENTIMTGDRIFGNRLAYVLGDLQRFDIVLKSIVSHKALQLSDGDRLTLDPAHTFALAL